MATKYAGMVPLSSSACFDLFCVKMSVPMKLRRLEELPALSAGRKVVLANGCFDILHVGHLRYLEGARALGDVLVVAINSDRSIRSIKDPGRPILSEDERVALVSAVRCVDYVVLFDESDVSRVLDVLR